jgi:hypothetical protein
VRVVDGLVAAAEAYDAMQAEDGIRLQARLLL